MDTALSVNAADITIWEWRSRRSPLDPLVLLPQWWHLSKASSLLLAFNEMLLSFQFSIPKCRWTLYPNTHRHTDTRTLVTVTLLGKYYLWRYNQFKSMWVHCRCMYTLSDCTDEKIESRMPRELEGRLPHEGRIETEVLGPRVDKHQWVWELPKGRGGGEGFSLKDLGENTVLPRPH